MLLLALDTTTAAGSVALWRDGLIEERAGDPGRSHAERLPGDLPAILGAHGLAPPRRRALRRRRRPRLVHRPADRHRHHPGPRAGRRPARARGRDARAAGARRRPRRDAERRHDDHRVDGGLPRRSVRGALPRRAGRAARRRGRRTAAIVSAARRSSTCSIRRRCRRRSRWPARGRRAGAGRVIVIGDGVAADAADPRRVLRRGRGAARAGAAGRHAGGPRRGTIGTPRPARTPSCPSTCAVPTPSWPAIAPPCVRRRETA